MPAYATGGPSGRTHGSCETVNLLCKIFLGTIQRILIYHERQEEVSRTENANSGARECSSYAKCCEEGKVRTAPGRVRSFERLKPLKWETVARPTAHVPAYATGGPPGRTHGSCETVILLCKIL